MSKQPGLAGSENRAPWASSVIVLALVTLAVGLPLLVGRVLAGHDLVVYLINAQQTAENLRSGELFPAWGGGFNAGFGAPSLLFFPPLTSYLHALPILCGIPVILGVSFWSLTGLFLSGVAIFGWLRSAGFGQGALQAAVVYMVSSYRLIDLYYRSALAEHWAFIWPPLIVWVATAPRLHPSVRSALTGFFVAMLLISNIPLAVFFGIGLVFWFLMSEKIRGRRTAVILGGLLGIGLSAFAIVPQALSSGLLSVDQYYGSGAGQFRPSANTLFENGLFSWDFNAQVSLGVVAAFVLVLVTYFLLSSERRGETGARAAMIGSVICLLVATRPAGLIWEVLPLFSKFQFPWRLASLLTFALAFIVAHLDRRRGWLLVALVVMVSLPFSGWARTRELAAFSSPQPPMPPVGTVFPDPYVAWEAGSGGWYWRHQNLAEIWFLAKNVKPSLLPELAGNNAPQFDLIRHRPAVVLEDPSAPVRVMSWGSLRRELSVGAPVSGTLMWRAIDFPEMSVEVDGEAVPIAADPTTGLIVHQLPSGEHKVTWSWSPFPALRWGRSVSMISFLVSCTLFLVGAAARRRHHPHKT
jgi:hypothetical protein